MPAAQHRPPHVLVAVLVFAAAVLCLFGACLRSPFSGLPDDRPDIAAVSSSSAVADADRRSTARLDARMAQLLAVVGPAGATAVTDVCGVLSAHSMFGGRWAECKRVVTAYIGTHDPPDRHRWTQPLHEAGWYETTDPQSWPASFSSADGAGVWLDRLQQSASTGPSGDAAGHGERYGTPVYRDQRTVDVAAFFPAYQYVLTVTTEDVYYPLPASPPPSPSPNDHACYSGSGRCVGG